tara:strand:- start:915 stop:1346 length:432 start_codon:yes stop_codon:yes gene_type:complete
MRGGPEATLVEHFRQRVATWPLEIKEVELKRRVSPDSVAAAEAELLLATVPDGAYTFVLDETGKLSTSTGIAKQLGALQDEGRRDVAFLIGGADGHGDGVRKRADHVMAFGRNTWPHLVTRGLLVEQIYRAQQILAGHPYHRA